MRKLISLLVVSCLAVSEACSSGAIASGGGGNGWFFWESPTNRRVAPCKMSADGQKVVGYTLDAGVAFVATKSGMTEIPSAYELTSISPNGLYAAGSAHNGTGTKAALTNLDSGWVDYVSEYPYASGYAVDDNGTLCGDYSPPGLGNTAFRKPLGGSLQTIGSFAQSSVSATTGNGGAVAVVGMTVDGGPMNSYWYNGTGDPVPVPSNGDTWCVPRGICDGLLVGETGTALAPKPFKWGPGDAAKTILPPLGTAQKGVAWGVANYPTTKMIGGYVYNSTVFAVVWLDNGAGGWVAREIKPLLLEAGYILGTNILSAVGDVSPDGRYIMIGVQKAIGDTSVARFVVLNTWFGTNLGQVKTQTIGSAVTITNRVVVAAPPDAIYVENDDRSSGIRINLTGHTVNVGDRISVSGTLADLNGERVVAGQLASLKVFPGVWPMPKPLTVPNKVIAIPDGLCLDGMLVRTVGTVKAHGEGCFVIDDGSSEHGLTVLLPAGVSAPALGDFVGVCGVGAKSTDAQGCLLLRSAADIEVQ